MTDQPRPELIRFFQKVNTQGPLIVETPCWEWTATKTEYGYGQFHLDDRLIRAHVYLYKLSVGPYPDGQILMHRCDNPSCVNPMHLSPGTHADNMRDKVRKGRAGLAGMRRIPKDMEAAIVARVRSGVPRLQVAQEFKICKKTVQRMMSDARRAAAKHDEEVVDEKLP